MNYEEKYKEALERARKWYNDSHITIGLKGNLKDIFPELKKEQRVDDETLRKNLIKAFNTVGGRHWGGLEVRDILTWLNKQDEINLEHYKDGENEKRKFVGYGFLKCKGDFLSFKEGETYWLEYVGKDNYNVRSDNLLGQTFHDVPKWKYKKDHTPLLRDSIILNKYGGVAKSPSGAIVSDVWILDYDELVKLPKEELKKQGEQKPSDWSEEDELMLLSVIQSLELTNGAAQIKIDWLKSLKQRLGQGLDPDKVIE